MTKFSIYKTVPLQPLSLLDFGGWCWTFARSLCFYVPQSFHSAILISLPNFPCLPYLVSLNHGHQTVDSSLVIQRKRWPLLLQTQARGRPWNTPNFANSFPSDHSPHWQSLSSFGIRDGCVAKAINLKYERLSESASPVDLWHYLSVIKYRAAITY